MRASELALRTRSRRRATGWPRALGVLWRFSRPHTLIGTTVGILGLYVVAVAELGGSALWDLGWVLLAGWCVNVFIVGINQLEDVELDRINKPELPLAAGELSVEAARRIVAVSALVPLVLALTQGRVELVGVLLSLGVGVAYSVPPVHLKRFPAVAAVSVAFVRSTSATRSAVGARSPPRRGR
jgi:homogentisate phytyltransferase/homogentisate geranylgeranyltransferase